MKDLSGNANRLRFSSGSPDQYPPFIPKRAPFLSNQPLPLGRPSQVGHKMSHLGSVVNHPPFWMGLFSCFLSTIGIYLLSVGKASKVDNFSCSLAVASKNNEIAEVAAI